MFETVLISAIALVLIIEGLLPFLFPNLWKKLMSQAAELSESQLRFAGLTSILLGLIVLWIFG